MVDNTGICSECKNKSRCSMHQKNPSVKVVDCQRFVVNDSLREIYEALSKDGEQDADGKAQISV